MGERTARQTLRDHVAKLQRLDEERASELRATRAAVAEALRQGEGVNDLAADTGWHRNTITAIRAEYGLPDARRHNKPPESGRRTSGRESGDAGAHS